MASLRVLAIDIGGTKMAAAVVDADGRLLARGQRPTLQTLDPDALFDSLSELCSEVLDPSTQAIGVGCGGPMRYPEGRVSPLNIPAWRGFPLLDRLAQYYGVPTVVDNDAKALALGECWQGAGRGSQNMLGMVISTGVGGGIILDGELRHGAAGNAGHIGHIVVWPGGPHCGCGAQGCLEAVASGTGLTRRLAESLSAGAVSSLGAGANAADIAQAAREGDAVAAWLYRSAGAGVGRALAGAAALIDLERVVIGGSIALKAWDLLSPPLFAELHATARLDFTRDLQVVQAALGDDAGLLGAARLAFDHLEAASGTTSAAR